MKALRSVTETNKPENLLPAIPYKANLNPGVEIQFPMGVPLGTIGEGTSAPHYLIRRGTTMRTMTALLLIGLVAGSPAQAAAPGYHLLKTVPLPGDGGWDYVTVDSAARRVYVSHGTEVVVLDADTCEAKGKITDLKGVHGIAVAPDLGRGFISNGQGNNVTIFDLKTLKTLGTVETGKNPDAIIFDPATQRVFAFNGRSNNATVIEAKDGKVAGTVELDGKPEFAAADGKGSVFVNLEDKNMVLKIDARKLTVPERWPVTPGEQAVSMAMDTKNRRLVIGCANKLVVIMNADNGKVVDKQPIGARVDASAFDPETGLVFCSNGDGTVTVLHQDGPDSYTVVETVKTQLGSKTMALDPKTHKLFIPAAKFQQAAGNARRRIESGTFSVLVFGQ
jgi:DNA-binding beta-propeller fold protein YncE